MALCYFCNMHCDMDDPTTYHRVSSWVHGPKADGATLRARTGQVAHQTCIDKQKAGQAVEQEALL